MRTPTLRTLVYLTAGIGIILSVFALLEVYDASLSNLCSVSSFVTCAGVLQSGKTTLLDIPDYLWGIGGFVLILLVAGLAEKSPGDRRYAYALVGVTTLGVAVALWLLYVELAQIHALCPVCVSAYLMGGIAWLGAIELARRPREDIEDDEDDEDSVDDA